MCSLSLIVPGVKPYIFSFAYARARRGVTPINKGLS